MKILFYCFVLFLLSANSLLASSEKDLCKITVSPSYVKKGEKIKVKWETPFPNAIIWINLGFENFKMDSGPGRGSREYFFDQEGDYSIGFGKSKEAGFNGSTCAIHVRVGEIKQTSNKIELSQEDKLIKVSTSFSTTAGKCEGPFFLDWGNGLADDCPIVDGSKKLKFFMCTVVQRGSRCEISNFFDSGANEQGTRVIRIYRGPNTLINQQDDSKRTLLANISITIPMSNPPKEAILGK